MEETSKQVAIVSSHSEQPTENAGKLIKKKKTQRQPVLKLELGVGASHHQMEIVATKLYGLEAPPLEAAPNSQHWTKTDEELYNKAKRNYDEVISQFLSRPMVYRFESTKQKMWDYFLEEQRIQRERETLEEMEKARQAGGGKARRVRKKIDSEKAGKDNNSLLEKEAVTEVIPIEKEIETYLDPFEVPPPWRKEVGVAGMITYYNPITKHRTAEKPNEEIWNQKVEALEKLTPREDLDGYEYRENMQERRKRQRIFQDYEAKLTDEINRRVTNPNELEQVEDCLFYIVDTVCNEEQRKAAEIKRKAREEMIKSWHVLTKGYKFKPLGSVESEDGEVKTLVSDAKLVDMLISATGAMLPLFTPPGLFEKHEAEREVIRARERARLEAEERERNLPILEKAALVMEIAKYDREAAMEKVKQEVKWRTKKLPGQLRKLNHMVLQKSKSAVVSGVRALLQASRNPQAIVEAAKGSAHWVYENFIRPPLTEEEQELKRILQDVKAEEEAEEALRTAKPVEVIAEETEEQRRLREYRASQPKPITFADTVQVKLTILVDPPPHFEKKLPMSKEEELKEQIKRKIEALNLVTDKISALAGVSMGKLNANLSLDNLPEVVSSMFSRNKAAAAKVSIKQPIPPPSRPKLDASAVSIGRNGSGLAAQGNPSNATKDKQPSQKPTLAEYLDGYKRTTVDSVAGLGGRKFISDGEYDSMLQRLRHRKQEEHAVELEQRASRKALASGKSFKSVPLSPTRDQFSFGSAVSARPVSPYRQNYKPVKKEYIDCSVRTAFENLLIEEISSAVCLPRANVSIEEIRRLPPNDENLLTLKQNLESLREEQIRAQKMEELRIKLDHSRRKAQLEGTFDRAEFDRKMRALEENSSVTHLRRAGVDVQDKEKLLNSLSSLPNDSGNSVVPEIGEGGSPEKDEESTITAVPAENLDSASSEATAALLPNKIDQPDNEQQSLVALVESEDVVVQSDPQELSAINSSIDVGDSDATTSDMKSQIASEKGGEIEGLTKDKNELQQVPDQLNQNLTQESISNSIPKVDQASAPIPTSACDPISINENIASGRTTDEITLPRDNQPTKSIGFAVVQEIIEQHPEPSVSLPVVNTSSAALVNLERNDDPISIDENIASGRTTDEITLPHNNRPTKSIGFAVVQEIIEQHPEPSVSLPVVNTSSAALVNLERNDDPEIPLARIDSITSTVDPKDCAPSSAEFPEYLKMGITNPDDLKRDPAYWLAQDIKELNAAERRQRRLRKLKLTVKETKMQERLRHLEELKGELLYDAGMYLEPVKDSLQPVLSRAAVYTEKTTAAVNAVTSVALAGAAQLMRKIPFKEMLGPRKRPEDQNELLKIDEGGIASSAEQVDIHALRVEKYGPELVGLIDELCIFLEETASPPESAREIELGDEVKVGLYIILEKYDEDSNPAVLDTMRDIILEVERRSVKQSLRAQAALVWQAERESRRRALLKLPDVSIYQQKDSSSDEINPLRNRNEDQRVSEALDAEMADIKESIKELQARKMYFDLDDEEVAAMDDEDNAVIQARLEIYEPDIVDLMTKMCIAVELADEEFDTEVQTTADSPAHFKLHPESIPISQSIIQKPRTLEDLGPEELADDRIFGCEITLMIFVNDEQRKFEGLEDIEAEDIAVLLQQQLNEPNSALQIGDLTRHIIDVQYKVAHRRILFKSWENFWVHCIHPAFFGYHTSKDGRRKKKSEDELPLPPGIRVINPVSLLSQRAQDTYNKVTQKDRKKKDKAVAAAGTTSTKQVVGALEDEFADIEEKSTLKLYRPNMSALTEKDIERLRRVHRAFERNYDELMKKGLVDGRRLRPEQYAALKDRDSAYRIFRTARQRYHHSNKEVDLMPKVELTEVSNEMFDGWVAEIKQEEHEKLKIQRQKTATDKKQRQQELALRSKFTNLRSWITGKLVKFSVSPVEIAAVFNQELEKYESDLFDFKAGVLNPKRTEEVADLALKLKTSTVSEQKRTRKLFATALDWAKRSIDSTLSPNRTTLASPPKAGISWEHDDTEVSALAKSDLFEFMNICYTQIAKRAEDVKKAKKSTKSGDQGGDPNITPLTPVVARPSSSKKSLKNPLPQINLDDIAQHKLLTDEELAACEQVNWFTVCSVTPEFLKCLELMPTLEESKFAREELVQFATITVELEPLFSKVVIAYTKAKEDAIIAAGLRKKRKQDRMDAKALAAAKKVEAAEEAAKLTSDEQRRALAEQLAKEEVRRALDIKYEAGLTSAHQHRFVTARGKSVEFCPICMQKKYDLWYENFHAKEKQWLKEFDAEIAEELTKIEAQIADDVEFEYEDYLYTTANRTNFFERRREAAKKQREERRTQIQQRKTMRATMMAKKSGGSPAAVVAATNSGQGNSLSLPSISESNGGSHGLPGSSSAITHSASLDSLLDVGTTSSNEFVSDQSTLVASSAAMKKVSTKKSQENNLTEADTVALLDEIVAQIPNFFTTAFTKELYGGEYCKLPPRVPNYLLARAGRPNASAPLLMTGLSLYTPEGICVVPEPEPDPESEEDNISISVKSSVEEDDDGNPPLGIRIRVWHQDYDNMVRGDFLGQIKMGYEDIMDPPKGFRTYPLEDDFSCHVFSRSDGPPPVPTGTLTIRLLPTSIDKDEDEPVAWKLEIIRATGLLPCTQNRSANPYCEIFWRGPAEKNERDLTFKKWIKVGQTKVKTGSIDPVFSRTDKNEYELPPIWTNLEVEGRGENGGFLAGGAWVARNNIPIAAEIKKAKEQEEKLKNKKGKSKDQQVEILSHDEQVMHTANLAVAAEIQARLEMTKLLWQAEERERRLMASEEKLIRSVRNDNAILSVKPQLDEQIRLGRLYTVMFEHMRAPSILLQRMRFRSAVALDSGGLRAVCKDQTTGKFYYVNIVPILYPEDEEDVVTQCNSLLGCQQPNLIKLMEYRTHQIRMFSFEGFPTINDRLAISILEKLDNGIPLLRFMRLRWESLNNLDFKNILIQILTGLKYLHAEGIIHRNIHANSVMVYELAPSRSPKKQKHVPSSRVISSKRFAVEAPDSTANDNSTYGGTFESMPTLSSGCEGLDAPSVMTSDSSTTFAPPTLSAVFEETKRQHSIQCKLEDFWFLSNPRRPGCGYSLGRADWGSNLTPPPEVARGQVEIASDIYAFGMCVLDWASKGNATLQQKAYPSLKGIDNLKTSIPLKWGDWVHALIRQCLQVTPSSRPTAEELIKFLKDPFT